MFGRMMGASVVVLALLGMGAAQDARAADYYTGKTIEMLVGADVGGAMTSTPAWWRGT